MYSLDRIHKKLLLAKEILFVRLKANNEIDYLFVMKDFLEPMHARSGNLYDRIFDKKDKSIHYLYNNEQYEIHI